MEPFTCLEPDDVTQSTIERIFNCIVSFLPGKRHKQLNNKIWSLFKKREKKHLKMPDGMYTPEQSHQHTSFICCTRHTSYANRLNALFRLLTAVLLYSKEIYIPASDAIDVCFASALAQLAFEFIDKHVRKIESRWRTIRQKHYQKERAILPPPKKGIQPIINRNIFKSFLNLAYFGTSCCTCLCVFVFVTVV